VFLEEAERYTFSELQKNEENGNNIMSLHRIPTIVLTYQQKKKKIREDL
jgi:hypothetical protein